PGGEPLMRPTCTLTGEHILQRTIGEEEIPALVRRRLIGVSGAHAAILRYQDRKSTRLNSSHLVISYAVFCLKKKKKKKNNNEKILKTKVKRKKIILTKRCKIEISL